MLNIFQWYYAWILQISQWPIFSVQIRYMCLDIVYMYVPGNYGFGSMGPFSRSRQDHGRRLIMIMIVVIVWSCSVGPGCFLKLLRWSSGTTSVCLWISYVCVACCLRGKRSFGSNFMNMLFIRFFICWTKARERRYCGGIVYTWFWVKLSGNRNYCTNFVLSLFSSFCMLLWHLSISITIQLISSCIYYPQPPTPTHKWHIPSKHHRGRHETHENCALCKAPFMMEWLLLGHDLSILPCPNWTTTRLPIPSPHIKWSC